MTSRNMHGKVVLITGASAGIGRALAKEYISHGASVILIARRYELIKELARESSTRCLALRCDVAKDGELETAVQAAVKEFGRIDIAIANAGFSVRGNLEELNLNEYRRQFETNVFGVLRTIYATLPEIKKTKGSLCVIGSVNGEASIGSGVSAYTMSKFAIRGLIDSLSLELSPYGVSVTHIMPGFTSTDFDLDFPEKEKAMYSWLKISAEKAAKYIYEAIEKKELEVILTTHGKITVYLKNHFPWLLRSLSSLISKLK